MKLPNAAKLIVAILLSNAAGFIGSAFTFSAIPTWYVTLAKPSFSPPNWLFGPVWTILYVLMGIAAFLVWKRGSKRREVREALGFFIVQLVLNAAWSVIFFGFRSPACAFFEIVALLLAIVVTMRSFYAISRPAAWLLVPYLAWVCFASALNYAIWTLN